MQKFLAIGNLTKDPEGGMTNSGTSYCKFSIAIPRNFNDKNGDRQVDFFNCTAWNNTAENICKYCIKGSKVCIVGQVQNRSFEGKNGKQNVTEVIVENIEFLSSRSKEETSQQNTSKSGAGVSYRDDGFQAVDDDLPY